MRIRLTAVLLALFGAAVFVSCGSGTVDEAVGDGGQSQGNSTSADASTVDARRFVFGAEPGRPVVYWIHTDW